MKNCLICKSSIESFIDFGSMLQNFAAAGGKWIVNVPQVAVLD
jgi:hypothetical protein